MGHRGLYVLVLLELLAVASEGNNVTRCWVQGKEVSLHPLECPAEFDGADAKFCCRLCFGANCCLPRRPRVNLDRCPPEARMAWTIQDHIASPDEETAAAPDEETTAAPDAESTAHPKKKHDGVYVLAYVAVALIGVIILTVGLFSLKWRNIWGFCRRCCRRERQDQDGVYILPHQTLRSNVLPDLQQPYSVLEEDPPSYSVVVPGGTCDLPPPYPGQPVEDPQETRDSPPPYPTQPVVAFRRSRAQGQDDAVVILPPLATPPEAAASAGARRKTVTGRAPKVADLPKEAATSGGGRLARGGRTCPRKLQVVEEEGLPEEEDLPEVAASGRALDRVLFLQVGALDGGPKPLE